jgi:hypothetical protein
MSRLRNTLIEVQKEETLKKVLLERYEQATLEEKAHLLSYLGDTIERDVDKMIREEIDVFNENTPQKKRNKKLSYFVIAAEVILTTLLAFMVNANEWYYVTGIAILIVGVLTLPLFLED